MDYSKFLTTQGANIRPSRISEMRKFLRDPSPSLVWLASGMPNPDTFPFKEMSVRLEDGSSLHIPQDTLKVALQYGPSEGYVPLVNQLKAMIKKDHNPPRWSESKVMVTVGAQNGMYMALHILLSPGECVAVPEPCYSDVLCMLSGVNPRCLVIETDEEGMRPDHLRDTLTKASAEGAKLKALYVVPSASNPTGTTMSLERRTQIYTIAHDFDIIILEDDPYYHLQYDDEDNRPPSFLSLDVDGRVLRFDSFSKIISSGLRVAYVTGPTPLIDAFLPMFQALLISAPMLSQVLVSELLEKWGEEGLQQHIVKVRQFYKSQRDAIVLAASTHLTGLCEWTVPRGGIFLWLKVFGVKDTTKMLMDRGVSHNIILIPGRDFSPNYSKPNPYMRAAFSCAKPEQLMKGMENLAGLIRDELALQNNQDK